MAPIRLRCRVLWKPVVTASAITSAITPAVTPSTEIAVITEITASLRCARRYRPAMNSSKRVVTACPSQLVQTAQLGHQIDGAFRPQQREQDHVANRPRAGQ